MALQESKPTRSWQEVARAVSEEKDPKKISQLSEELNRLLREREKEKLDDSKKI